MTRSIFYGIPAFVSGYTSSTQCTFWPVSPDTINFDPTKLIPADLGNNPQAHRNGTISIAQIQTDDFYTNNPPGMNTIGPLWPDGTTIGGCWLESTYYTNLGAANKPPRVPINMQCHDYELSTVWYWTGNLANRRFHGFQVAITQEKPNTTQALCQIWAAGTSLVPGQPPFGSWWLDLATVAHPVEAGFTAIWTGVGAAKIGALFLDHTTVVHLALAKPKIPAAAGHDLF